MVFCLVQILLQLGNHYFSYSSQLLVRAKHVNTLYAAPGCHRCPLPPLRHSLATRICHTCADHMYNVQCIIIHAWHTRKTWSIHPFINGSVIFCAILKLGFTMQDGQTSVIFCAILQLGFTLQDGQRSVIFCAILQLGFKLQDGQRSVIFCAILQLGFTLQDGQRSVIFCAILQLGFTMQDGQECRSSSVPSYSWASRCRMARSVIFCAILQLGFTMQDGQKCHLLCHPTAGLHDVGWPEECHLLCHPTAGLHDVGWPEVSSSVPSYSWLHAVGWPGVSSSVPSRSWASRVLNKYKCKRKNENR